MIKLIKNCRTCKFLEPTKEIVEDWGGDYCEVWTCPWKESQWIDESCRLYESVDEGQLIDNSK